MGREVVEADGSSSGAATTAAATGSTVTSSGMSSGPVSGTSTDVSSTSSSGGESTAASSTTGGFDDGCPPGVDEPGAVYGVGVEGWDLFDTEVETGTCAAFDFAKTSLFLRCLQDGGPPGEVEVEIAARGGPVVADALAAMVGLEDLQLVMEYFTFGLNPVVSDLSLRTSTGELLVLYSEPAYVDTPVDPVGLDLPGWTDPFQGLQLADHGCDLIPSEWLAGPYTRFALEATGDDGEAVSLYEPQQATVTAGGHPYEVSLVTAALFEDPCNDCPAFRFHFSVVRHP